MLKIFTTWPFFDNAIKLISYMKLHRIICISNREINSSMKEVDPEYKTNKELI